MYGGANQFTLLAGEAQQQALAGQRATDRAGETVHEPGGQHSSVASAAGL